MGRFIKDATTKTSIGLNDHVPINDVDGGNVDKKATVGGLIASKVLSVAKPSDTTRTNTDTLTNDPDLTLPVKANKIYKFELFLSILSATIDPQLQFTVPAGAVMFYPDGNLSTSSGEKTDATTPYYFFIGASAEMFLFYGFLKTAGTAGNVTLQWAPDTIDASNTTFQSGSFFTLMEL